MSAVIAQTAKGDITPDEASNVTALLEAKRRAIETCELESRLAAIEFAIRGSHMSLKARLTAVENIFNRDRDFTLIRVYGGPVGESIEAVAGSLTLRPHDNETIDAFIDRAESAAIEAGQSCLAITGLLPRNEGKETLFGRTNPAFHGA
jgi:hypothetical protein